MFQVGDKIVHPMHGAGVVDSIVQKKINGVVRDYYILKLPVGGMMVMIPTENSQEIGVRPVMGKAESDEVIGTSATGRTCSGSRAGTCWRWPGWSRA